MARVDIEDSDTYNPRSSASLAASWSSRALWWIKHNKLPSFLLFAYMFIIIVLLGVLATRITEEK